MITFDEAVAGVLALWIFEAFAEFDITDAYESGDEIPFGRIWADS